jgi:hypothetical protein
VTWLLLVGRCGCGAPVNADLLALQAFYRGHLARKAYQNLKVWLPAQSGVELKMGMALIRVPLHLAGCNTEDSSPCQRMVYAQEGKVLQHMNASNGKHICPAGWH